MAWKEYSIQKEDLEVIDYTFKELSIFAEKRWLSSYPNKTGIAHWHNDLEFIIILTGEMIYSVNGVEYLLSEGDAIFVNSRNLHYGYFDKDSDCEFICLIFPLSLFGGSSYLLGKFVNPIINNIDLSCLLLHSSDEAHLTLIQQLKTIFVICETKESEFELMIISRFLESWKLLYRLVGQYQRSVEMYDERRRKELCDMIEYIHLHYAEKITLDEIAISGNVCRSNCCKIFQEFLKQSPIAYLMDYRLYKSTELLCHSTLSMTEIAYQCGFSNSSYFIKMFKQSMNETPMKYKKKMMNRMDTLT